MNGLPPWTLINTEIKYTLFQNSDDTTRGILLSQHLVKPLHTPG